MKEDIGSPAKYKGFLGDSLADDAVASLPPPVAPGLVVSRQISGPQG